MSLLNNSVQKNIHEVTVTYETLSHTTLEECFQQLFQKCCGDILAGGSQIVYPIGITSETNPDTCCEKLTAVYYTEGVKKTHKAFKALEKVANTLSSGKQISPELLGEIKSLVEDRLKIDVQISLERDKISSKNLL
jgi:hypothetical protein